MKIPSLFSSSGRLIENENVFSTNIKANTLRQVFLPACMLKIE